MPRENKGRLAHVFLLKWTAFFEIVVVFVKHILPSSGMNPLLGIILRGQFGRFEEILAPFVIYIAHVIHLLTCTRQGEVGTDAFGADNLSMTCRTNIIVMIPSQHHPLSQAVLPTQE